MSIKIDYGEFISPEPIELTIGGKIKKPKIQDIYKITFPTFFAYESFILLTPKVYVEEGMATEKETAAWDKLSVAEKKEISMFFFIKKNEDLQKTYLDILNFFIEETVIFYEEFFVLTNRDKDYDINLLQENDIVGIITEQLFPQFLSIIAQLCYLKDPSADESEDKIKFKSKRAREIYLKLQKANKENKSKEADKDSSLPNVISAVCSRHPSINYTNVGMLTVGQLFDSFSRLRNNAYYEITAGQVSHWGAEEGKFDDTVWFKNIYDK